MSGTTRISEPSTDFVGAIVANGKMVAPTPGASSADHIKTLLEQPEVETAYVVVQELGVTTNIFAFTLHEGSLNCKQIATNMTFTSISAPGFIKALEGFIKEKAALSAFAAGLPKPPQRPMGLNHGQEPVDVSSADLLRGVQSESPLRHRLR